MTLSIRLAQETEVDQISLILLEGAERVKQAGHALWDPADLTPQRVLSFVKSGECFVVLKDLRIVGTFRLELKDPIFWPEKPEHEAVYFHKIAVTKAARGQGITAAMVHWASEFAKMRGRRFLRLDTDRRRTELCRYYESLGFKHHSFKRLDWIEVSRFEMELESTALA